MWFTLLQHGCIVSCSSDGVVKVWAHNGVEITSLSLHTQAANACDIHVKALESKGTSWILRNMPLESYYSRHKSHRLLVVVDI